MGAYGNPRLDLRKFVGKEQSVEEPLQASHLLLRHTPMTEFLRGPQCSGWKGADNLALLYVCLFNRVVREWSSYKE